MTDQTMAPDIQELLDRDQIGAPVDCYVTTLDEGGPFDERWTRALSTEDIRLEHEVATLAGIA